jgi:hypothetical protein
MLEFLLAIASYIAYESQGASMDLRAQVQNASVASYSWSFINAPNAQSISGANTYRVQFLWGRVALRIQSRTWGVR